MNKSNTNIVKEQAIGATKIGIYGFSVLIFALTK